MSVLSSVVFTSLSSSVNVNLTSLLDFFESLELSSVMVVITLFGVLAIPLRYVEHVDVARGLRGRSSLGTSCQFTMVGIHSNIYEGQKELSRNRLAKKIPPRSRKFRFG